MNKYIYDESNGLWYTELKNFPLYCPKCKQETIINVQDMKITLADSK